MHLSHLMNLSSSLWLKPIFQRLAISASMGMTPHRKRTIHQMQMWKMYGSICGPSKNNCWNLHVANGLKKKHYFDKKINHKFVVYQLKQCFKGLNLLNPVILKHVILHIIKSTEQFFFKRHICFIILGKFFQMYLTWSFNGKVLEGYVIIRLHVPYFCQKVQ